MKMKLSKQANKIGIKWIMGDGIKNAKEARKLEKAFIEGMEKIKAGIKSLGPVKATKNPNKKKTKKPK